MTGKVQFVIVANVGLTHLNRQGITPALAGGARKITKKIIKLAKNPWCHRENLGVLRG